LFFTIYQKLSRFRFWFVVKNPHPTLPYLVEAQLVALGKRIAVARKARCWTQGDLASRAGVGLNSIVNIER
jgi:DNA-binding XRE family transcriptional regulator